MPEKLLPAQKELRRFGSPAKAKFLSSFFKSGPGQYGEGDIFLGVKVPETRAVAAKNAGLKTAELRQLLKSPFHEDRLLALIILTTRYEATDDLRAKKKIFDFYMKNKRGVNNWDLVDTSARAIVGDYCLRTKNTALIRRLADSKHHWDRRIAMVATHAHIREGHLDLTWQLARQFFKDKEDLMHKATGWMLREAGKKNPKALRKFVARYGADLPRTALRYAIEHYSKSDQKKVLEQTRKKRSKL